jgi:hypothetical protein
MRTEASRPNTAAAPLKQAIDMIKYPEVDWAPVVARARSST